MNSKEKVKYSADHPSPSSETTRDKNKIATLHEENKKLRDELKLLQRECQELKQESMFYCMFSCLFLIWLIF